MQIIRRIEEAGDPRESVVTIGTFDGVHLGHRSILREVTDRARIHGWRSMLITFDPHPREVVGMNGSPLYLLTTIDERLELIAQAGIETCLVVPFTRSLSLRSAEEFFEDVIIRTAGARHVVVGYNHKFGNGRGADATDLARLAAPKGIGTTTVPACTIDGATVSSTAIRTALLDGAVETASKFLGRPYRLVGLVQRGEGLGRRLGYPTANLHLDQQRKLLPKRGVYSITARLHDESFRGVMNIGVRPTVSEKHVLTVEAHLLDFDRDIYGETLTVDVHHRVRDEQTFASVEALIAQIAADVEKARAAFSFTTEELTTIK